LNQQIHERGARINAFFLKARTPETGPDAILGLGDKTAVSTLRFMEVVMYVAAHLRTNNRCAASQSAKYA